jgi:pSer/pThr/pTyr-binding forkhead associated (FHA) protein
MSQHLLGLFLQSCGDAGPLELDLTPPGQAEPRRFVFEQPYALIGRNPGNDLALDDDRVSKRHVYLQRIGGRVFCLDLDSRAGILWDGSRCPSGWLEPRNLLQVGRHTLRLGPAFRTAELSEANGDDGVSPLQVRSAWPTGLPPVCLEFSNGVSKLPSYRLPRLLTLVGRAPSCKLQLSHASVSRIHCSLLRTPLGVWVIDLVGRGGTWVNGENVRWARLVDGDRLEVGRFEMRFRYDTMKPASPIETPLVLPRVGRTRTQAVTLRTPEAAPTRPKLTLLSLSGPDLDPADDPSEPEAFAAAPGPASETSLLLPVMNQLNLMQHQMFDQFHQSMLMMVQMFSQLHTDQMRLIRDELDQLHRLTSELRQLQAELARYPKPAGETPAPPAPAAPGPVAAPPVTQPAAERPETEAARAPSDTPARSKPAASEAPPVPPPGPEALPLPPEAMANPHLWLSQRIAAMHEERQSRWQKIMDFVMRR